MMSSSRKQALLYAGVFAAPLLLIRLLGGVTSTSEASTPESAETSPTSSGTNVQAHRVNLTDTQEAALAYMEQLSDESFGEFPFVFRPKPTTIATPAAPRALSVEVNAIMSTSTGPTAMIDGKLVHEGDTVGEGNWTIHSIDPDARTVVFHEQETGRLVTKIVAPI